MNAAALYQPGGPDAVTIEELAIPVPADSQVLSRIKAFCLNRLELITRKGYSLNVVFSAGRAKLWY